MDGEPVADAVTDAVADIDAEGLALADAGTGSAGSGVGNIPAFHDSTGDTEGVGCSSRVASGDAHTPSTQPVMQSSGQGGAGGCGSVGGGGAIGGCEGGGDGGDDGSVDGADDIEGEGVISRKQYANGLSTKCAMSMRALSSSDLSAGRSAPSKPTTACSRESTLTIANALAGPQAPARNKDSWSGPFCNKRTTPGFRHCLRHAMEKVHNPMGVLVKEKEGS